MSVFLATIQSISAIVAVLSVAVTVNIFSVQSRRTQETVQMRYDGRPCRE